MNVNNNENIKNKNKCMNCNCDEICNKKKNQNDTISDEDADNTKVITESSCSSNVENIFSSTEVLNSLDVTSITVETLKELLNESVSKEDIDVEKDNINDISSENSIDDQKKIEKNIIIDKFIEFIQFRNSLEKVIAELNVQIDEMKENFQYELQDYRDTLNRVRLHAADEKKLYNKEFIVQLFELIDNLELISNQIKNDKNEGATIKEAVSITLSRALLLLSQYGVIPIEVKQGDVFNPLIHDAITLHPSDVVPNGCVLSIFKTGYKMYNDILRPAAVMIATEK